MAVTMLDRLNAAIVMQTALGDEMETGVKDILLSPTLGCFIEYRIAQMLCTIGEAPARGEVLEHGGLFGGH